MTYSLVHVYMDVYTMRLLLEIQMGDGRGELSAEHTMTKCDTLSQGTTWAADSINDIVPDRSPVRKGTGVVG